jgi:hypothetical protein
MTVDVDLSSTPQEAQKESPPTSMRTPVYDHDSAQIDAVIQRIIRENIAS